MNGLRRIILLLACWSIAADSAPALPPPERVFLRTEHVDLRVDYNPARTNALTLFVRDEDRGVDHPPDGAVLVVGASAELALPADFPPLGQAGEPLWVLPASQDPALLYLGLSTERNPPGVFAGPIALRVTAVDGPGLFFLWQNTPAGDLVFKVNSRDGLGPEDGDDLPVGAHSHYNWGFTARGFYRITFTATGRRIGNTEELTSGPVVFTFHVEPLPPSPFQLWQAHHWPGITDPIVIGPDADPDRDGQPNLWEYVMGTIPTSAVSVRPRQPSLLLAGTPTMAAVSFPTTGLPADTAFCLWTAEEAAGPWTARAVTPQAGPPVITPEGPGFEARLEDPSPVAEHARRFYRAEVLLTDQP